MHDFDAVGSLLDCLELDVFARVEYAATPALAGSGEVVEEGQFAAQPVEVAFDLLRVAFDGLVEGEPDPVSRTVSLC
ncbi:hypothetical protein [Microbacterium sp.]|uniref:hypothetical protein n=1 Tax=Microbacterium sp. TaxID=51671 RepID=UPI003F6F4AF4